MSRLLWSETTVYVQKFFNVSLRSIVLWTVRDLMMTLSTLQAHYPASCSHMSQWMDDGGYYEGMSMEAQSKHLAKLISKRCPSCQAQIEKNEGCLQYVHHRTCC